MTTVAVMKDGEERQGTPVQDLFPANETEFTKALDYISIVDDLFSIHVRSTFLLTTESGKWFCDVRGKDGFLREWNGTIYSGDIIYLGKQKTHISGAALDRYNAIIAARDTLVAEWKK